MLSDPLFLKACGIIGLFGFGLYVINYVLLTTHRVHSHQCRFFAVNLVAAACVLTSQIASFNLPATLIQSFWIVLSLIAIFKRLHLRRGHVQVANTVAPPPPPRHSEPEPQAVQLTGQMTGQIADQMTRQICTTRQQQMI